MARVAFLLGPSSVGANQPRLLNMFKNIYVKKLWSLNPDEYHLVNLDEAINNYGFYCGNCVKPPYACEPKSFQEWLETEI